MTGPGRNVALAALVMAAACSKGVLAPPPAEHFAPGEEPPPELAATVVDAPILVDLNTAVELLEEGLPDRLGDIDRKLPAPGNRRGHFAYEITREPFRVTIKGDTFQIATTIHYRGRGWYNPPIAPEVSGSCGTSGPRPRARIVISIRPEIDRNWRLIAKPRLTHLAPLTRTERDQCEVSFLKFDVTSKVLGAARTAVQAQLPKLAAKLATLDVKGEVEKIWTEISKPIRLADSVWLLLEPRGVRLSSLSGNRQMLGGMVGITAYPRIETGPEPLWAPTPLPPLEGETAGTGLNLLVEARFDYPVIGASLTEALAGREIRTPGGLLEIEQIGAFGVGGGRLALGVRFRGTASGQIYFVGTPRFDSVSGRITVPDLDYDASTTPLLVRGLAWLRADEIRSFLRSRATFPSAEAMERLADLAVKGMNRQLTDGVVLTASLNRTDVIRIAPRRDALYLQGRAQGQAALHVTDRFFARFDRNRPADSAALTLPRADSALRPIPP